MSKKDKYLDIEEAARRVGKSVKTLRRWVHENKIAYRVEDKKYYFDIQDLEARRSPETPAAMDTAALLERIEALEEQVSILLAQRPRPAPYEPTRATTTEPAQAAYPPDSIPLYLFYHGIPPSTVKRRVKDGALPAVQGSWKQGNHIIKFVLDAPGRSRFYELFHNDLSFNPCADCPHSTQ